MAEQELRSRITVEGGDQGAKEIEKVSGATKKLGDATKDAARASADAVEESGKSALTSGRAVGVATALGVAIAKVALALRAVGKAFGALPAVGAIVGGSALVIRTLREEVAERIRLANVIRAQGEALDELKAKGRDQKASLESISDRRRFGGFDAETATRVQGQAQQTLKAFPQLGEDAVNSVYGLFGGIGLSQRDLEDLAILQYAGKLDVDPQSVRSPAAGRNISQRYLRRGRQRGDIDTIAGRESVQGEGAGRRGFRPGLTEFEQEVQSEAASPEGSTAQLRAFLEGLQVSGGISPETDLDLVTRLIKAFNSSEQLRAANLTPQVGPPTDEIETTAVNRLGIRPTVDIVSTAPGGFVSDFFKSLGMGPSENVDFRSFKEAVKALERVENLGNTGGDIVINNYNNQGQRIVSPSARTQQATVTNGSNALRDRELVGT